MTTIAYRDGVLAADTLTTSSGGVLCHNAVKIGGRNGLLWAATGDASWGKRFRDWCANGANGGYPPPPDENSGGSLFMPDGSMVVFHINGIEHRKGLPFWADGSGCDYAMGAMQMGASVAKAVEVAMLWDHRTGGVVQTVSRNPKPCLTVHQLWKAA